MMPFKLYQLPSNNNFRNVFKLQDGMEKGKLKDEKRRCYRITARFNRLKILQDFTSLCNDPVLRN